ncbi:hypothetical protein MJO28_017536, partial [Puccinia striiformis f. sp. tritici]
MSLAHTTLKQPCPFTVPHIKPQSPGFPLIHDIYGVVPLYHFTIPGNTRNGAEAFVSTMQSTICPRSGIHIVKPDSCKIGAPSQKCDCKSWFWISHHIKTDSLRVAWQWDHNHDPYSEEE